MSGPGGRSSLRSRADAAAQVLVGDLDDPALDDADAHHLGRVLRLRDGEQVVAFDGAGGWRLCAYRGPRLEPASDVVVEPAEPDPCACSSRRSSRSAPSGP